MGWIYVSSINTIMAVVSILMATVSLIHQYYIPDKLDLKLNLSNYEDATITNDPQSPLARFFHVEAINKHIRNQQKL